MSEFGINSYRSKRSLFLYKAVAFFLFIVFVSFCQVEAQQKPRDAYVASAIADARTLLPPFADDSSSSSICELIYNGLTKVDKDLNVVPDVAKKWDVSANGKVITFYLKENVTWHDGERFTAGDVEFTYKTMIDPEKGCPYISSYSDIEKIEVLDDYTISFYYKEAYAPALLKFGMGIIPKHIFEGIEDIRGSKHARCPVGTGPYKFSSWEGGRYIVLEANEDYFEHTPGIEKYVYRIIPDQAVEFLELISDGIDSMALNPYQYMYRSNTPKFKKAINKYNYPAHSYVYIGYNLADPLFSDVRVRQALSYAIDTEEIIDAVLLGLGEEATGPFLKGSPYYNEGVLGYPYDAEKAASLLREAGWIDSDGDGVLDSGGEPFEFTLVTNQGNQVREDVATIIQAQWAKIGVKLDIQVIAWAAFLDQFINKKKFQAVIMGWTTPIDPDVYSVWHSESIQQGGLNFISYSNKEVDALIEEGRREFDPVKRKEIYHKVHELISNDAPYTFLFVPYATPAINKRFKGITPAPAGIGYNFIDWYVPKDEVKYKF